MDNTNEIKGYTLYSLAKKLNETEPLNNDLPRSTLRKWIVEENLFKDYFQVKKLDVGTQTLTFYYVTVPFVYLKEEILKTKSIKLQSQAEKFLVNRKLAKNRGRKKLNK